MRASPSAPSWRDWYIFGARWLIIVGFTALTLFTRGDWSINGDTAIALAIAGGTTIVALLLLLLRIRPLEIPLLLLSDLLIIGALVWMPGNTAVLPLVGIMTVGLILTLFRPSVFYSLLQPLGALIVIGLVITLRQPEITIDSLLIGEFRLPALEYLIASVLVVLAAWSLEQQRDHQNKTLAKLAAMRSEQLDDIRERTRAIYEMTMTFSETQHFERILNAALDAGQLGLRGRMGRSLVAGVLLFQAEQPGLRVIAARKFTRSDMAQLLAGKQGIIGEALREASPIIGGRAKNDVELGQLVGFHGIRSTLCVPLRAGYDNYGVLIYGSEAPGAFTNEHMELLTAIGVQATIALQNYVLYQTLLEEKDRIARVAEDERKQLARQLHDGPTQKVSALAMMTNIIHKMLEKTPDKVPDELRKMEEIARSTSREMRHMLFTLRPLVLENQGLSAALEQLAEKMRETHGQQVNVRISRDIEALLDSNRQGVVFYLVEEAINNARKHAKASLIQVDIRQANGDLVVRVMDNGAGFDLQGVDANYDKRGSLGMVNMRERAALLDGTLNIESAPGKGTRITLIAPLYNEHPSPIRHDETIVDIPIDELKVGAARKRPSRSTQPETSRKFE
jgi:signal transduction histidine kinase